MPERPAPTASLPPGYRFRDLGPADQRDVLTLDGWAFPTGASVESLAEAPSPLSWDRAVGVFHDADDPDAVPVDGAVPVRSDLVGMHASYPFARFPVPGGTTRASGLTWVAVHPGHRRRGLLTAMIDAHVSRSLARGEAVSVLFAAEATIYGRFGYGVAAQDLRLTVPRRAALRDVPGAAEHTVRIETVDPDRHAALCEDLHERAGRDVGGSGLNRPGWVSRETSELRRYFWTDHEATREGREPQRIVIVERDGEPRGYTTFRRKLSWETLGARGWVSGGEVVALDAAAAKALYDVLLDLDLTDEVRPFMIAPDDPLVHLLASYRGAAPTLYDNLWVRLLDVPVALAARRYAGEVDVVLEVRDALLPANAGRWRLRASAFEDGVSAERTTDAADLSLDVRDLGSVYLGGPTLAALAGAGLVEVHSSGALAAASAAFAWPVAPLSSWVF
ncbi:GNAT family N-acetyltransferase [Luteimicrobium subarcticum]|uniref:Putative acetyltransferase n=1 Tax=Luteimicrobium subarcticum TaxID=620910 RepID=A0A2M8WUE7_9MICO|nr:GNAT family N-acetyltransferase [Luteimicrobium subarcticum]PJI94486.1 putative acetyltransferase [Luteimicrobium subarcticum]